MIEQLTSRLPHWFWPGDGRPRQEIDDEIAEELRLHVDLLAEENERRGLPPDEARQTAEERFGDLELISRRCRNIKQGDVIMLRRLQLVVAAMLLVAVLVVGWQQWVIASRVEGTMLVMNGFSDRLSELKDMMIQLEPMPAEEVSLGDGSALAAERRLAEARLENARRLHSRCLETVVSCRQSLAEEQQSAEAAKLDAKLAEAKSRAADAAIEVDKSEAAFRLAKAKHQQLLEQIASGEAAEIEGQDSEARLDAAAYDLRLVRIRNTAALQTYKHVQRQSEIERQTGEERIARAAQALQLVVDKASEVKLTVLEAETVLAALRAPETNLIGVAGLAQQQGMVPPKPEAIRWGAVEGVVTNNTREPLAGARVLLTVRGTFPNGDKVRSHNLVTDKQGRFRFDKVVPLNVEHGVHLAAFADGYTFATRSFENHDLMGHLLASFELWLEPATPITVQLRGPSFEPHIFRPIKRTPQIPGMLSETHLVHPEGIEHVQAVSDADGRVTLSWFAAGDYAEFTVGGQFGEPTKKLLRISLDGEMAFLNPQARAQFPLEIVELPASKSSESDADEPTPEADREEAGTDEGAGELPEAA